MILFQQLTAACRKPRDLAHLFVNTKSLLLSSLPQPDLDFVRSGRQLCCRGWFSLSLRTGAPTKGFCTQLCSLLPLAQEKACSKLPYIFPFQLTPAKSFQQLKRGTD